MKKILKKYYKDIIIFIIPLILMGIVLYIFYPGVMTYDSFNQLNQIIDNDFVRGHPVIHTLFEYILYKPFKSVAMISIAQIIVFSSIWTYICNYLRKIVNNKKFFIFQIFLTIIFSINPMNALFTISLWKDILYSYLLLLLSFLLFRLFYEKDITNKKIIIFSLLLALIPNIRYNGISVFLGILVIVLLLFIIKKVNYKKILLFLIISIGVFNLLKIPEKVILKDNAMEIGTGTFYHKELQLLGHYHINDELDFLDVAHLRHYINMDELIGRFNPYWTDNVAYTTVDKELYNKNHSEVLDVLLRTSINNPKSFIKWLGNSTTIIWKLKQPKDVIGFIYATGFSDSNNYHHIEQINLYKPIYNNYCIFASELYQNDLSNLILFSPSFMMYVSLMCLLIILIITKNKSILLISLPMIFNSLGLMITIPTQDARYVGCNYSVGYLSILLAVYFLLKYKNEKNKNKIEQK